jgi:hypothetical protein
VLGSAGRMCCVLLTVEVKMELWEQVLVAVSLECDEVTRKLNVGDLDQWRSVD